jgi:hypothetical protein
VKGHGRTFIEISYALNRNVQITDWTWLRQPP